jgi:hypothetical protein
MNPNCTNIEAMKLTADGYRFEPLEMAAQCIEERGYAPTATTPRIVCWEFQNGRTLRVNNMAVQCVGDQGVPLGKPRAGGYCIQVGAGGAAFAGILLPTK